MHAPINSGETSVGPGGQGVYGGTDPEDSSGILRYLRVEFVGFEFALDDVLNGITLQGVGSGTVVDFVQVHFSQDDGLASFGGTVNGSHILCTGNRDDSFDWVVGRGRGSSGSRSSAAMTLTTALKPTTIRTTQTSSRVEPDHLQCDDDWGPGRSRRRCRRSGRWRDSRHAPQFHRHEIRRGGCGH